MLRVIGVTFVSLICAQAPIHATGEGNGASPNPFTDKCTFTLTVPEPGSRVHIAIYDLLGQQVKTLYPLDGSDEPQFHAAGEHPIEWDGNDFAGREVVPSVYLCVLYTEKGISRVVKVIKNGWR